MPPCPTSSGPHDTYDHHYRLHKRNSRLILPEKAGFGLVKQYRLTEKTINITKIQVIRSFS